MGVKLTFGEPACPWVPGVVIPPAKEGWVAPAAVVLARDHTDEEDWQSHVTLTIGRLCGTATKGVGKLTWRVFTGDESEDAEADWEVLMWHDPTLPIDVWRLELARDFLSKNLMEAYDSKLWCLQFESIWKNQPWGTYAPTNQYGDKIGPAPPGSLPEDFGSSMTGVTSALQAAAAAISKSNLAKSIAALPGWMGDPSSKKWKEMIQNEPDFVGAGTIGWDLAKPPVITKDTPFSHVMIGSMYLMNMTQPGMGLPVMLFPDEVYRPVLLAWQMLRGPGNMWSMANSAVLMKPATAHELMTKTPVIYRKDLEYVHEQHVKNFGKKCVWTFEGGVMPPVGAGVVSALDKLTTRMGMVDGTRIKLMKWWQTYTGSIKIHVVGGAQMPKLGPEIIEFDEEVPL